MSGKVCASKSFLINKKMLCLKTRCVFLLGLVRSVKWFSESTNSGISLHPCMFLHVCL